MNELDRYSRQTLLSEIGVAGQERLLASAVTVVGCGALGTVIASGLVRAGVGRIRIVDRDYIELNNLQRQVLFDEEDIAKELPKAIAAVEKLRKVNSRVELEPVVADVNPDNVERLIGDADLVLDGTDNFETRLLINDACVKHDIPWIYGAVISTYGMTMNIIPHQTPCFRCFLREIPLPGSTPTCDMVGVLGCGGERYRFAGSDPGAQVPHAPGRTTPAPAHLSRRLGRCLGRDTDAQERNRLPDL